jgi:hypothetical protein
VEGFHHLEFVYFVQELNTHVCLEFLVGLEQKKSTELAAHVRYVELTVEGNRCESGVRDIVRSVNLTSDWFPLPNLTPWSLGVRTYITLSLESS